MKAPAHVISAMLSVQIGCFVRNINHGTRNASYAISRGDRWT